MTARKRDEPVRYVHEPLWETTAEFERYVAIAKKDEGDGRNKELDGLSPSRRVAVEAEAAARKWGRTAGFTRADYWNAMEHAFSETRLRVGAPVSTEPKDELIKAWLQPEARDLWRRHMSAQRTPRLSAIPGLQFTLGVMLLMGGSAAPPHLLHARADLADSKKMFGLVSELALGCDGKFRCEPIEITRTPAGQNLKRLSEGFADQVRITLAEIAAKYLSWGVPVGRYLAVDGTPYKAWSPQRSSTLNGKENPELEAYLRRRTPEAGFIIHKHGDKVTKAWRGYSLVGLVDLATGMALAFDLADNTEGGEGEALRERLLPQLFSHSPKVDVRAIVGDGAFDNDPTHGILEMQYGVHLVASRGEWGFKHRGSDPRKSGDRAAWQKYNGPIAQISGNGQATCRAHGTVLTYLKLDRPSRRNPVLEPGVATPGHEFRSRFACPDGCGEGISFPTQICWDTLPYYPHTPNGRDLKKYAFRRALLARRNQIESEWGSLETRYKLSLDGPDRARFLARQTNEALTAFALVTQALLALRAERTRRGELL